MHPNQCECVSGNTLGPLAAETWISGWLKAEALREVATESCGLLAHLNVCFSSWPRVWVSNKLLKTLQPLSNMWDFLRAAKHLPITVCYLASGFAAFTWFFFQNRGDCVAHFWGFCAAGSPLTGDGNECSSLLLFKMTRICLFSKFRSYTIGQVIPKSFVSPCFLILGSWRTVA